MNVASAAVGWRATLAEHRVASGLEVCAWVPDKRLAGVAAALAERGVPVHTLTREEECVGYAAGYRAAGGLPVVLMQCSGLGNALNALGSLAIPFGLAFPLVLSMRGTLGERNPSQVPLGRATVDLLAALGIQAFSLRRDDDAPALARGVVDLADGARTISAIILEPVLETDDGRD